MGVGLSQRVSESVVRHHQERKEVHRVVDRALNREGKRKKARVSSNLSSEFVVILTQEGNDGSSEESWQETVRARADRFGGKLFRTYEEIGETSDQDTEQGKKKFNDIVHDLNQFFESEAGLTLEQARKFIPRIKKLCGIYNDL